MNPYNVWSWPGCQLAVSVASEVCSALRIDISEAKFYTDSTTALAWLRTTNKTSVYVSNRVCKVRDRTSLEQWRYVPGTDNPADIASRGCRPRRLTNDRMWFQGPTFLLEGPEPEQPQLIEDAAVREELISFENHLRKVTLFRYAVQTPRGYALHDPVRRGSRALGACREGPGARRGSYPASETGTTDGAFRRVNL